MPDFPPVRDQLDLLLKGTETCVRTDELEKKLRRAEKTGKPLKVKVGFDPSTPDLHLGHTVVFRKMRHFQELGHEVIFVIGDFTGMIGDPTGKKVTRPVLTREEVLANAETYKAQIFHILDARKTTVDFNSRWLSALGADGLVRLAAKYTLAQLLERDDFKKRFEANKPIAIHELLYPLCQGYDSVALQCDVELGGTDQLFNLLVGRDLMREWGQEPQVVMTLPLLEGLDGVEKMSKSLGNAIGVTDPPDEMYGKVMSISDALMWRYFTLLTDLRPHTIESMKADVIEGKVHPKKVKMDLARRLVADFHGQAAAVHAEEEFERRFGGGKGPVEGESFSIGSKLHDDGSFGQRETYPIINVLVETKLAASKNEARQKIREGAVATSEDGVTWRKVESASEPFELRSGAARHVRLGKKFKRVELSPSLSRDPPSSSSKNSP